MKILKRLIQSLALLIAIALIAVVAKESYFWLTDGFSLTNISHEGRDEPQWQLRPLTEQEKTEADKALSQKFYYLDKGHQAYVFASEDGQYVLKFLKFQKYRHHWLVDLLPWPASWQQELFAKKEYKKKKQQALFNAWKIAFDELPAQTGVFLVQLNRGSMSQDIVTVYNKSDWPYEIDLGQHVFMLQRKVDMLGPTVDQYMADGQIGQAKELLDRLLELYLTEYSQGISEKDRYIVRNTGVADGYPIQIDTGRLRKNARVKQYPDNIAELTWKVALLQQWLSEHHPKLALHLQQRLQALQDGS